ncbi:MAG TPA: hypothetical protein VH475_05350 [Tepidisphaeraceae bacterium]
MATTSPWVYDNAVAASLVYAPPVTATASYSDFSREGRAPAAYAGFDDVITTYYYLWQDDRQGGWGWGCRGRGRDCFVRDAITVRTGVSYR